MSGAIQILAGAHKHFKQIKRSGFHAYPTKNDDGTKNLMLWEGKFPGQEGTDWEGGVYTVRMTFTQDYPTKAPMVHFHPPLFHPNVYESGKVCLSILGKAWKPSITIQDILLGLQTLLDEANNGDPAQSAAHALYKNDRAVYDQKIREQAKALSKQGF